MVVNAVLAVVFGQLYETLGRRKTLLMCLVLLAVGVVLPAWAPEDDPRSEVYTIGRVCTAIFAQAVLQNPLLNDYVKKHKRGCGSALQQLGKEIGEIFAFILFYNDYYADKEGQDAIFYSVGAAILIVGLFLTLLLIKEPNIKRDYKKDKDGNLIREREDENDD